MLLPELLAEIFDHLLPADLIKIRYASQITIYTTTTNHFVKKFAENEITAVVKPHLTGLEAIKDIASSRNKISHLITAAIYCVRDEISFQVLKILSENAVYSNTQKLSLGSHMVSKKIPKEIRAKLRELACNIFDKTSNRHLQPLARKQWPKISLKVEHCKIVDDDEGELIISNYFPFNYQGPNKSTIKLMKPDYSIRVPYEERAYQFKEIIPRYPGEYDGGDDGYSSDG